MKRQDFLALVIVIKYMNQKELGWVRLDFNQPWKKECWKYERNVAFLYEIAFTRYVQTRCHCVPKCTPAHLYTHICSCMNAGARQFIHYHPVSFTHEKTDSKSESPLLMLHSLICKYLWFNYQAHVLQLLSPVRPNKAK